MSQFLNIFSLPDELISIILENADYSTLIACRRSCHHLKDIVDSSSVLTYTIELGATGMCNGPPNDVGPAERLKRLQKSQTFWMNSVWSQPDHFPYSESTTMMPYPAAVSGNLMIFRSGNFADSVMLLLLRFPSELRDIQEQQWHLCLEFERVEYISADDSQDLLIFSSLPNIHVRTLSTGGIHPLTNSLDYIDLGAPSIRCGISSLCIYDHLLAFPIHELKPYVLVLNWKTGEQMAKIPCSQHLAYCSIIDRTKIIFPYRVYDPEPEMHLRIVTLPDTADDSPLRSYDFVLDIAIFDGIDMNQREYLRTNTLPSNPSDSPFPGIFHVDPRNRLLALEVETNDPTKFTPRALYVMQAALLSYIATHPSDADTVLVPWEAWGPGNTRIVNPPDLFGNAWFHHTITCGMHALLESTAFRDQKTLRVMDYHSGRIARILAPYYSHFACTEGTVTEEPHHPDVTVVQQPNAGTSSDGEIPYAPKNIPLPDGLQFGNIRCILGEDVVVLLKNSWDNENGQRIESIFYHPI